MTLAATAVVAIALAIGGIAFWGVLYTALHSNLSSAAAQDAKTIAAQINDVDAEDLRQHGVEEVEGVLPDFDDQIFQIIDRETGKVMAASQTAQGAGPLLDSGTSSGVVEVDDASYATVANRDDAGWTVIAGRSTAQAEATLAIVAMLLTIAVPLLAVVVALTSWFVTGRALAPVERMRRQVDAVTASDLSQRVADPGTRDEIGRLATTLNVMLARLQTASATQRRFISDASHELKSPLASLRQYAEVARAHPDRITGAELSDAILEEGARLEQLVQSMLLLARADEHAIVPVDSEVDLDDLLFAEAQRVRAIGRRKVDTSGVGPVRVRGDAGLLDQLVRNLVDNAARHASSTVALAVSEGPLGVVVTVDDDGVGVADANRERVFERFVRLDDARSRDSGGSGLGLAIVREIAAVHDGEVRVTDSPLGGARFEVRLGIPRN